MSDLIERQKALDAIQQRADRVDSVYSAFWEGLIIAQDIVKNVPSAEPERKTFHVIDRQTGREADPYDIALNEDWAKGLMYCDMEGFALLEDGTLILTDECGRYEFPPDSDRFEIVFDCGAEMKK